MLLESDNLSAPRGSPTDEEYIQHLEFFNEQRQKRIDDLERERGQTRLLCRTLFKILFRLTRLGK